MFYIFTKQGNKEYFLNDTFLKVQHFFPSIYKNILSQFIQINFHIFISLSILFFFFFLSCSVMSNSLWAHRLYSPWNSPGQNTGVGSLSLLQGIFPTQVSNQDSCNASRFFTSWDKGSPIILDLPNPGIKPGSSSIYLVKDLNFLC